MKLLETYSNSCSVEIKHKPQIVEKFFPLVDDKYITIQTKSGMPAKDYSYFQEVIDLIYPFLEQKGIKILHLGQDSPPLMRVINLNNQTSVAQANYIVKRSLLHVGNDSWLAHAACAEEVSCVAVYGSTSVKNHSPYHFNSNKTIFIESHRNGARPTFSREENPKTVDLIGPEQIAKAIGKLLGFDIDYPYSQCWVGQHHQNFVWEMVANNLVNLQSLNISNIVVRMDFFHNEEVLEKQLQIGNCAIVCSQPIDIELLKKYKPRITELVYEINENHVPNFVEEAQKVGLNRLVLISKLPEEQLNPIKLYYIDAASPILPVPNFKKESISEIKGENDLYYRSRKFTISNNKVYPSKAAWLEDKPMDLAQRNLFPVIDNDEFWGESQHFAILKKSP